MKKVVDQITDYMRGAAMDGGIISLDISQDMHVTPNQASARLAYMEVTGRAICVGEQKNVAREIGSRRPFKIYILPHEKEEYYGLHNS